MYLCIQDEYIENNLEQAVRYYAKGKKFLIKTKTMDDQQIKTKNELLFKLYLNSGKSESNEFFVFG